jgi:hypothetical protein
MPRATVVKCRDKLRPHGAAVEIGYHHDDDAAEQHAAGRPERRADDAAAEFPGRMLAVMITAVLMPARFPLIGRLAEHFE